MNETIKNLEEALAVSPDNIPLRLHLAELMLAAERYPDAAGHFELVLQKSYGNVKARAGLATCYYHTGKFSAAIIIYEQLQNQLSEADNLRFVKCLIREGSMQEAGAVYQKIIQANPNFSDPDIDSYLRVASQQGSPADEQEEVAGGDEHPYFMEKPAINFSAVGGMQRIKNEISLKIIQPLKNPELYKAFGKKAGGGILLYGPPGCGKTFIARAAAGEIAAKFINIGLHDILDMWIGNSEKNLHEIFELARQNTPCVLFFDEVDAMGASRSDLKQSAMRHVINQFLAEMDGAAASNEGVLVLAATNAPWSVDAAFRRPGRFDRVIFVEPPDEKSREQILRTALTGKPTGEIDLKKLVTATPEYSGADLMAIIDIATEDKLTASMEIGVIQPISTKDLLKAVKAHRPTTGEWFATARNYALYANETGLYDDILKYMKIKK